jgi:hypothetical protein
VENGVRGFLNRLMGRREPATPKGWICATCGQAHDELPAVGFPAPLAWEMASEQERAEEFDLTTDTCIWKEEHFFVRACLDLPFNDHEGAFQFGVWTTLSRENFFLYLDTFDEADPGELPPMFGWFSNSLPGYPETLNLKCTLHARPKGLRPLIELEATDHPLSREQQEGIPFSQAVAYAHEHLGI